MPSARVRIGRRPRVSFRIGCVGCSLPLAMLAAVVVLALAACGQSAGTPAAKVAAVKPLTCKQQYHAWKTGPAKAVGKKLVRALDKMDAAASAEDIPAMTKALRKAKPAAVKLQRYPIPKCADPAGYWASVLTHVQAAADNAGSGTGLGSILLAEVPLKSVPGIEKKLSAELVKTGAK